MTESTIAIEGGNVLQKEKTACAKVLSWERKEIDKLQELGGGLCGWRVISEARLVWDRPGNGTGTNHAELRGHGKGSEFSSKGKEAHWDIFTQGRRRSFQICQAKVSNSVSSPVSAAFLIGSPIQGCLGQWRQSSAKISDALLTKAGPGGEEQPPTGFPWTLPGVQESVPIITRAPQLGKLWVELSILSLCFKRLSLPVLLTSGGPCHLGEFPKGNPRKMW